MKGIKRFFGRARVGNRNPYANIIGSVALFWTVSVLAPRAFGIGLGTIATAVAMILLALIFIDQVKKIQAMKAEKETTENAK